MKEIHQSQFKYNDNYNESLRVSNQIARSSICESSPLNTQMLASPQWKHTTPVKWICDKNFVVRNKSKSVRSKSVRKEKKSYEPYIDGHSITGDLSRKRKQSKEIHKNKFNSTIAADRWSNRMMNTQSIRAGKVGQSYINKQLKRTIQSQASKQRVMSPVLKEQLNPQLTSPLSEQDILR